MATSTGTGSRAGAIKLLESFLSNGTVPSSWINGKAPTGQKIGDYTLTVFQPTSQDSTGVGQIVWGGGTSAEQTYQFTFTKAGKINGNVASQPQPDQGQVKEEAALGIPDAVSSAAGAAASWAAGLGKLLTDITNSAFWKRIGIGALGVLALVIGIVLLLRRHIPSHII